MTDRTTITPQQLIDTIYLGDRACKAVIIDGWNSLVRVQVDYISRIRDSAGNWDYYSAEDIRNGFLVFAGVREIELRNGGYVPNDLINGVEVVEHRGDLVVVELSIDSVDTEGSHHETQLCIACESMHLEDPERPGIKIT